VFTKARHWSLPEAGQYNNEESGHTSMPKAGQIQHFRSSNLLQNLTENRVKKSASLPFFFIFHFF
jgi:hypothetical protein